MHGYQLLRVRSGRSYQALCLKNYSEVLAWAMARWPETEWASKEERIALDLIEAFSGCEWKVLPIID